MTQIVRKFEIDAGHRVLGHEGKCKSSHGHRYVFHVHLNASELDNLGRVIDFSVVKEKIGTWLDDKWDHGMILHEDDPIALYYNDPHYDSLGAFKNQKVFLLPYNPTAENLARYLYEEACVLLQDFVDITVLKVECWETPNCMAYYP